MGESGPLSVESPPKYLEIDIDEEIIEYVRQTHGSMAVLHYQIVQARLTPV